MERRDFFLGGLRALVDYAVVAAGLEGAEFLHVGRDYHVRGRGVVAYLLDHEYVERLARHVEHRAHLAVFFRYVLWREVDGDYRVAGEYFLRFEHGEVCLEAAVDEQHVVHRPRVEDYRYRHGGAQRGGEVSVAQHDGVAVEQVRRYGSEGVSEVVEVGDGDVGGQLAEKGVEVFRVERGAPSLRLVVAVDRDGEERVVRRGRSVEGSLVALHYGAAGHYLHEVDLFEQLAHLGGGVARAVEAAHYRAHAGAYDGGYGDVFAFEHLEDADVREPLHASAAEDEHDAVLVREAPAHEMVARLGAAGGVARREGRGGREHGYERRAYKRCDF